MMMIVMTTWITFVRALGLGPVGGRRYFTSSCTLSVVSSFWSTVIVYCWWSWWPRIRWNWLCSWWRTWTIWCWVKFEQSTLFKLRRRSPTQSTLLRMMMIIVKIVIIDNFPLSINQSLSLSPPLSPRTRNKVRHPWLEPGVFASSYYHLLRNKILTILMKYCWDNMVSLPPVTITWSEKIYSKS